MTQEEIYQVEKRLNLILPDDYIMFQLNYPKKLIELKFNYEYLTNNSEYLIEINEMLRNGGLPIDYLAIGNNIGGNFYFIKADNSNSFVYSFDHEEVSEREDSEIKWEEILTIESKDLHEFSEHLIDFWGDSLLSIEK